MRAKKYLLTAVAGVALSGCTSMASIDYVNTMRATTAQGGTPFTRALAKEYQVQVNDEVGEGEWTDAAWFARRGLQAAKGEIVLPADVAAEPEGDGLRSGVLGPVVPVPSDRVAELSAAHGRLLRFLDRGGRDRQPDVAAHAQGVYDCWVEEEWEWVKPADIACRTDFLQTEQRFAPVVAAAPSPVVQPMRYHAQVFFDWDRSNIKPGAAEVIGHVADDVRQRHPTRIDLIGHTDSSGPDEYNLKLSVRRADAVKGALVGDGVPSDKITTKGVGKAGQLVPTADGVREPQNRRTEIILK